MVFDNRWLLLSGFTAQVNFFTSPPRPEDQLKGLTMKRTFIASVLSLSLAFTSISAPAQAGEEEVGQVIAGALALFILGKAIQNAKKDDPAPTYAPKRKMKQPPKVHKPVLPRHRHLPASCVRTHLTAEGDRRVLGKRCLQNRYQGFDWLPAKCERKLWTSKGIRHGYGIRCLKHSGYRLNPNA